MKPPRSILPDSVAAALDAVGERLTRGLPAEGSVAAALDALDALPPHLIGAAQREIAGRCLPAVEPRRLLQPPGR